MSHARARVLCSHYQYTVYIEMYIRVRVTLDKKRWGIQFKKLKHRPAEKNASLSDCSDH